MYKKIIYILSLLSTLVFSDAFAVSGETCVNVAVPEYIVLRYFNELNITLSATSTTKNAGASDVNKQFIGLTDFTETLEQSGSYGSSGPSNVVVKLKNSWGVIGFSPSGNVKVSITGDPKLIKDSSYIGMTDYTLYSGSTTSSLGSLTIPLSGTQATYGDLSFKANFSNTTKSGIHAGKFTITAETI